MYQMELNSADSLIEWKVKTGANFENMFEILFDNLDNLKNWGLSEEKMKTMKTKKIKFTFFSQDNMNSFVDMDDYDYKPRPKKRKKYYEY